MTTRTPPRRYTRTEFAGMLLGRLESKGVTHKAILNRYAKELYTGHAGLNPRNEANMTQMFELTAEEQVEWRRLMRYTD